MKFIRKHWRKVCIYPIYADIAEWMSTHVISHDSVIK